jgi:hypothetical protein
MAYMSQNKKQELAPAIKAVLKKYGVKGTLAVDNHSTLVLNISEGSIDFCGNLWNLMKDELQYGHPYPGDREKCDVTYIQVNEYHTNKHYTGKAKKFFAELIPLMNIGNYNRSDIMTDYFDVGWYISINVGRWNKPYIFKG